MHERSDDRSCPTCHHVDSITSRFPELKGKNSRKSAPSTGRLPPMPMPMHEMSAQAATQS